MRKWLTVFLVFIACSMAMAQMTVNGKVTDSKGEPVIAGIVSVEGAENILSETDLEGNYTLTIPADVAKEGKVTVLFMEGDIVETKTFDYVEGGTTTQSFAVLELNKTEKLNEVVVQVGYGSVKKKDATGAVDVLRTEDFNKGAITTAENLLNGRVSGLQITTAGSPGAGSTIRIRGGASINAVNEPLIVIDGLPIDNDSPSGSANKLAMINPNEIESFSVLKDASATAIYGSRASNGIIIITTKKGKKGDWKFNYDARFDYNTVPYKKDVLNAEEFTRLVQEYASTLPDQPEADALALLGYTNPVTGQREYYDTDWQDYIFENRLGTTHGLSARGQLFNRIPSRFSVGYNYTPGILITSQYQRTNLGTSLNPTFFDNYLKVNLTANVSWEDSRFAETGAIGNALRMDPTKPVYTGLSDFQGFYQWTNPENGNLETQASKNPLAMLLQRHNTSQVRRIWGNIELDYKFHFLPELRAVLNLGLDTNNSEGSNRVEPGIAGELGATYERGYFTSFDQFRENKLMDTYLNYVKEFGKLRVDVTGGYSYQNFYGHQYNTEDVYNPATHPDLESYKPVNLQSFFGRANLSFYDKYLLTLSYRHDGTSSFSKENRWGKFPAVAFAWKLKDEAFLTNNSTISDLKLRLGWGITGQQAFDKKYLLAYLARLGIGNGNSRYIFGNGQPIYVPYPLYRNDLLKWEETTTWNIGLDYGFFANKLKGNLDIYYKESKDLLAEVDLPAGSNYVNQGITNFGDLNLKGAELGISYDAINSEHLELSFNYNVSYNKIEITKLNNTGNIVEVGNVEGLIGNNIQAHIVGRRPFSYYVYKQLYDVNGNPINGAFADLNGDGTIDDKDRYMKEGPNPDFLMGFSTNFRYKNLDFSMAWRASLGNYVYNNLQATQSYRNNTIDPNNYLANITSAYFDYGLNVGDNKQAQSDMWIEDGSFVKLDNITLGYTFQNIFDQGSSVRFYTGVQNVLTITNYSGDDPEVFDGRDYNIYPRARIYIFGFNLNF